jgi:hypothetical protein
LSSRPVIKSQQPKKQQKKHTQKLRSPNGPRVNRHGLTRDIPDNVRRDVRQSCFNGCVLCGRLPFQYEHFNPPFVDAREHHADGIALLCAGCHDEKTRGLLSSDHIATARRSPRNRDENAYWTARMSEGLLTIKVGSNTITAPSALIRLPNGHNILTISRDIGSGGWNIDANFVDDEGNPTLTIKDNVVTVARGVWDFDQQGTSFCVRAAKRKIVIEISFEPEQRLIHVRRLNMRALGCRVSVNSSGEFLTAGRQDAVKFINCKFNGGPTSTVIKVS